MWYNISKKGRGHLQEIRHLTHKIMTLTLEQLKARQEELEARQEELETKQEELESELDDYFELDDLNEFFSHLEPLELFNRFFYGNINGWRPTWIRINGYGNFDDGDASHDKLMEDLEQIEEDLHHIREELEFIENKIDDLEKDGE